MAINLTEPASPEHERVLTMFLPQLLVALVEKHGGVFDVGIADVDATGDKNLHMAVVDGTFHLEVKPK